MVFSCLLPPSSLLHLFLFTPSLLPSPTLPPFFTPFPVPSAPLSPSPPISFQPSIKFLWRSLNEIVPSSDGSITFSLLRIMECFFKSFVPKEVSVLCVCLLEYIVLLP